VRTNPFGDVLEFLIEPEWTTAVFWVLLIASVAIAVVAFRRDPAQRTPRHLWMFASRLLVGAMWWQQTLWKLPPTYTDQEDGSGGLRFWMEQMTKNAAFSAQAKFVKSVVLEHFYFFAPQVYFAEVTVALSLMLGIFTRLGGTLGFLMAVNLWLGLYRAPAEWPWTYFFLVIVNGSFAVFHAGRSLGVDALLAARSTGEPRGLRRLIQLAT
jgi:uncharacterized membrane protein YphA (DoxX/SURF4 family)